MTCVGTARRHALRKKEVLPTPPRCCSVCCSVCCRVMQCVLHVMCVGNARRHALRKKRSVAAIFKVLQCVLQCMLHFVLQCVLQCVLQSDTVCIAHDARRERVPPRPAPKKTVANVFKVLQCVCCSVCCSAFCTAGCSVCCSVCWRASWRILQVTCVGNARRHALH